MVLLCGCAASKIATTTVFSGSKFTFDKVKFTYSDSSTEVTLKGRITVFRDSLVQFKFYGPVGVEVLSGKFDTALVLKSNYLSDNNIHLIETIKHDIGVDINGKFVELLLSFKTDQVFQEILQQRKSNFNVTLLQSTPVSKSISLVDSDTKSTYLITFVNCNKIPLRIIIERKAAVGFWKVLIEVYSLHN